MHHSAGAKSNCRRKLAFLSRCADSKASAVVKHVRTVELFHTRQDVCQLSISWRASNPASTQAVNPPKIRNNPNHDTISTSGACLTLLCESAQSDPKNSPIDSARLRSARWRDAGT